MEDDDGMKTTESRDKRQLTSLVTKTPVVGSLAHVLARQPLIERLIRRWNFRGSSCYWEQRYVAGGNSGAGSYGRLAQFKADTLNAFVARAGIRSVIEFGCGDGAQLELAAYPFYVGVDVSLTVLELCSRRFTSDPTKRFYLRSKIPTDLGRFDLSLSLDVIYHLVEDDVFDSYMRSLFERADRFVVIYSSNKSQVTESPHVRHREFTSWILKNKPQWRQIDFLKNKYPYDPTQPEETSFADFYFFGRADESSA
jgi:SAM-dependent methyltransferase